MSVSTTAPDSWTATGLERPVFLDESGRRGRVVRVGGGLLALLVAGWLAALLAGAIGFGALPALHGHHRLRAGPVAAQVRHHATPARATRWQ